MFPFAEFIQRVTLFQLTFRVRGSQKIFRGSENTDLPKFSCSTTQCVGSGSQLSLVFDPRPVAYLEHWGYLILLRQVLWDMSYQRNLYIPSKFHRLGFVTKRFSGLEK